MTRRTDKRRQLFARIQLVVFAAMFVMSLVHVHEALENVVFDCTECQHNVHHSGHLSSAVVTLDDCVLCQFAGLSYLVAVVTSVFNFVSPRLIRRSSCHEAVAHGMVGAVNLRAPPFSFC